MVAFRAGSGSSQLADPGAAGRTAAEQAVEGVDGAPLALVIVYASTRYDLAELLRGIRTVTRDAPLVGSTSSGQFLNGEMIPPGRGVVVLVLSGGTYRFGTAATTGLRQRPFDAGRELARSAVAAVGLPRERYSALMVLADSLAGDLQSLLNGVYQVAGAAVPVVGGASGADECLTETFVFHGDQVLTDAAVAVWIDAARPLTVAVGHGWRAHGLPLLVTRADGPVVHEIGGRPAFDVYQEWLRSEGIVEEDGVEWWETFHPTRAFGLIEPDGSESIRGAFVDPDRRVRTFTSLPPFCAVRIMTADPDDLLDVGDRVVAEALGDGPARVLLTFSCAARMEILQERAPEESARLQKAAGSVSTFGFFTYGEFARNAGVSGYHNATIAALAL